jgi:hypothetical protein
MKKLLYLMILMSGFALISCEKDDEVRPFVAFNANMENAPDYTAGVWQVPYPNGEFEVPKTYTVSGSCDYMESIVPEQSFFNTSNLVWDSLINGFRGNASITLSAPTGDKLYMDGEFLIFLTYYNEAYFNFTGGTGIFDASEGWLKSTGQGDPVDGLIILDAAGKICEPKGN